MPHVEKMPVKLMVNIYGDWSTVIGIHREFKSNKEFGDRVYNRLLDLKPDSEEDAEYSSYRFECNTEREAIDIMNAAAKNHLRYTIAMRAKDADDAYEVYIESSNPYSSKDNYCSLRVPEPIDAVTNAKAVIACKEVREDLADFGKVREITLARIKEVLDGVKKHG